MTEAIAQAGQATQATQAPQYVSRAAFDKLVGYANQLVAEHNQLEKRIEALEAALLRDGNENFGKKTEAADGN